MLHTFVAEFLSSAKLLGLVLSILKADRVRRGARDLRRDRACHRIVYHMRLYVARRRVTRLQHKDAWRQLLTEPLCLLPAISPISVSSPKSPRATSLTYHHATARHATASSCSLSPRSLSPAARPASASASLSPQGLGRDRARFPSPRESSEAAPSRASSSISSAAISSADRARQIVSGIAARGRELSPRRAIGSLRSNLFSAPEGLCGLGGGETSQRSGGGWPHAGGSKKGN